MALLDDIGQISWVKNTLPHPSDFVFRLAQTTGNLYGGEDS